MVLNRKQNGATVINVSDNIGLKLYYDNLSKDWINKNAPATYIWFKKYKEFNVEIYTKTRKQTKRVRRGYYDDCVGNGDVRDLLLIKDAIYNISLQLRHDEFICVHGTDERRNKIYYHYLCKDTRFCEYIINCYGYILIFNPTDINPLDIIKDCNDKECKSLTKKRNKEWREIINE